MRLTIKEHPLIRDIDHLVLPVSSLGDARTRLSNLGFRVAPDAQHPFGTGNACVFLSDGTYLEPLAIDEPNTYSRHADAGNTFVARDRLYRQHRGEYGFSALVAKSDDADMDHQRFVSQNMSGGEPLSFSRPVTLPDGTKSVASFRLAFAGNEAGGSFFLFTCQRVAALPADRGSLEYHDNGVKGIREVVLRASQPLTFCPPMEGVFGVSGIANEEGALSFATSNVPVQIIPSPDDQRDDKGLFGQEIVFSVSDLAVTAALLAANGVEYTRKGARLLVPPAIGQGAIFAFEE
jgi:hypothetical protein